MTYNSTQCGLLQHLFKRLTDFIISSRVIRVYFKFNNNEQTLSPCFTCMFTCVIYYNSYVEERLACILLLYQYHNIYCLVSYAVLYFMPFFAKSPRSVIDAPRTCPRSSRAVCLAARPHEAPVSRLQCHPRPRARSTEPKRLKTRKC